MVTALGGGMLWEYAALAASLQKLLDELGAAEYDRNEVSGKHRHYVMPVWKEAEIRWDKPPTPDLIETEHIEMKLYAYGNGFYEMMLGIGHKSKRVLWRVT
jgi:hypothetical protein